MINPKVLKTIKDELTVLQSTIPMTRNSGVHNSTKKTTVFIPIDGVSGEDINLTVNTYHNGETFFDGKCSNIHILVVGRNDDVDAAGNRYSSFFEIDIYRDRLFMPGMKGEGSIDFSMFSDDYEISEKELFEFFLVTDTMGLPDDLMLTIIEVTRVLQDTDTFSSIF